MDRYFGFQGFSKKHKLYLSAQRLSFGGKFFIYAPRYVSAVILPPFFYIFFSALVSLLFGFLSFACLLVTVLALNLVKMPFALTLFMVLLCAFVFFLCFLACIFVLLPIMRSNFFGFIVENVW